MVERLRKRDVLLQRWRWPLAIGTSCLVMGWLILLVILAKFHGDSELFKLTLIAYLLPPCFVFLAISSCWLGYVVSHWHGDPKTQLLLRLIEELETHDS